MKATINVALVLAAAMAFLPTALKAAPEKAPAKDASAASGKETGRRRRRIEAKTRGFKVETDDRLKTTGGAESLMSIEYRKLNENDLETFIGLRIAQLREEGAKEDTDLRPALLDYYHRHLARISLRGNVRSCRVLDHRLVLPRTNQAVCRRLQHAETGVRHGRGKLF